ncbi:hypothetical protein [Paraglaciecola sp.]
MLNNAKQECLLVEQNDDGNRWLATADLLSLRVITPHSQFTFVNF